MRVRVEVGGGVEVAVAQTQVARVRQGEKVGEMRVVPGVEEGFRGCFVLNLGMGVRR